MGCRMPCWRMSCARLSRSASGISVRGLLASSQRLVVATSEGKRAAVPVTVGGAGATSGEQGASSRSNCRLLDLLHGMRMVDIVPMPLKKR